MQKKKKLHALREDEGLIMQQTVAASIIIHLKIGMCRCSHCDSHLLPLKEVNKAACIKSIPWAGLDLGMQILMGKPDDPKTVWCRHPVDGPNKFSCQSVTSTMGNRAQRYEDCLLSLQCGSNCSAEHYG
jgi:hypothetical protein